MDLSTFLQQRRPEWRQLEAILQRVESSGSQALADEEAVAFGRLYRRAASDLNQAQTFVSGESTVRYLNDLVARAYLAIYGKDRLRPGASLIRLVRGYPAVFRRNLARSAWRPCSAVRERCSATSSRASTQRRRGPTCCHRTFRRSSRAARARTIRRNARRPASSRRSPATCSRITCR